MPMPMSDDPGGEQAMPPSPEHGDEMSGAATPWAHFFAVIVVGVWLISSPSSFDYRDTSLAVSDIVSGTLIIAFAVVTLTRRSSWAPWASTLVGIWLLFAPLVFKAPTAEAYVNDTLVGILVIAFVLLMPGMPGMRMLPGPDVPPGWSYNPSTWPQRGVIIGLAVLNFLLSRYLTTYQLGYTDSIWDPFFSPGTQAVLTSEVSRSFPISDAGLGAVLYMIEGLMGFMGDRARWRTMPWMVAIFGVLVVPVGVVSILLIMLQPVSVGQWCTVCLVTALAMLIMVALTLDEVVAMGIFLVGAGREGQSVWQVFWLGGTLAAGAEDRRTRPDVLTVRATVWGTGVPWNLMISAALGVWLVISPVVLGVTDSAADSTYIFGALVVTVAVVAMAEVGRAIRFLNILIGAWLLVMSWLLNGSTTASMWTVAIVGVALILLSIRRGEIRENYGPFNRYIL
jgi:uncharacterized membrane protein